MTTNEPGDREFDVLLLGATGVTGKIALAYLAERARLGGARYLVGARDSGRVTAVCAELGIEVPPIAQADAADPESLAAFASRGRVLVNLTGPYARNGEAVVRAAVEAGTSYVDLSAETQNIRAVDAEWHVRAVEAGVAVVQTAGVEALPADILVHSVRRAIEARGERMIAAEVELEMVHSPAASLANAISGGTARSVVGILADPGDPALEDVAFRIDDPLAAALVRSTSPARLWPRITRGGVVAPMVPFSFINPPVIHRTAWLLATESGVPFEPLRYREGTRFGAWGGATGWALLLAAELQGGLQALLRTASGWPLTVRRRIAERIMPALPASGVGPDAVATGEWRWRMRARGISDGDGVSGTRTSAVATLDADGHPGYTTTARMICELALVLADGAGSGRTGCITPALALGDADLGRFAAAGMRFAG